MTHAFVQARFDDVLSLVTKVSGIPLMTTVLTPTGKSLEVAGTTAIARVAMTAVILALVIGVSHLTWQFVELPGQRAARRLAKP